MYQMFVDMGAYELNFIRRFDLACHLDGQPMQFMMKLRWDRAWPMLVLMLMARMLVLCQDRLPLCIGPYRADTSALPLL